MPKSIRRQILEALESIRKRLSQIGMNSVETTSSLDGIEQMTEAQTALLRELEKAAGKAADADVELSAQLERVQQGMVDQFRKLNARFDATDAEVGQLSTLVRNQSTAMGERMSHIEAELRVLKSSNGAGVVPRG